MKLEIGKRYVTRNGRITKPLTYNEGEHWPYEAEVSGRKTCWDENGNYSRPDERHLLDLVREHVEPSTKPETPAQKIRRLEHNIEVMRDSYLPARLEIAARMMQGILANNELHVYDLEKNAAYALDMADALIKKYEETTES